MLKVLSLVLLVPFVLVGCADYTADANTSVGVYVAPVQTLPNLGPQWEPGCDLFTVEVSIVDGQEQVSNLPVGCNSPFELDDPDVGDPETSQTTEGRQVKVNAINAVAVESIGDK